MYAVLEKKREYIDQAADALRQELSDPIGRELISIEINALLSDYVGLVDESYDLSRRLDLLALEVNEAEWVVQFDTLQILFASEECVGRKLLALAGFLTTLDYELPELASVQSQVQRVHDSLNWPEDYGESPKYREMIAAAQRDHAVGECEEGGWDVPE